MKTHLKKVFLIFWTISIYLTCSWHIMRNPHKTVSRIHGNMVSIKIFSPLNNLKYALNRHILKLKQKFLKTNFSPIVDLENGKTRILGKLLFLVLWRVRMLKNKNKIKIRTKIQVMKSFMYNETTICVSNQIVFFRSWNHTIYLTLSF